jgi:hypothetical protein
MDVGRMPKNMAGHIVAKSETRRWKTQISWTKAETYSVESLNLPMEDANQLDSK